MHRFLSFVLLTFSLASFAGIKIGSYNIRNFDYDQRYRIQTNKPELTNIIRNLEVDILSVEEINNTAEFKVFVANNFPDHSVALSECGGAHGQRLGFIYNKSTVDLLSFNEDLSVSGPEGAGGCDTGSRPLAIALFQIKSSKQKFYGITAHLKSGSDPQSISKREKQFTIIKNVINELKTKTGIKDYYLAGDLNTTTYINRGNDYKILAKVTAELDMVNLAQNLGCSAYWWGGTDDGVETPSLLDHVIVTKGLLKTKMNVQVGSHCKQVNCREVPTGELGVSYESVSDHCPVTSTIQ